jgi:hypothetical protein
MGICFSMPMNDEENIVVSKGKNISENEQALFKAGLKSSQNFYVLESGRPTEVISSLELKEYFHRTVKGFLLTWFWLLMSVGA